MEPKNPNQPDSEQLNPTTTPDPNNLLANSLPQITPNPSIAQPVPIQQPVVPPEHVKKSVRKIILILIFLIFIIAAVTAIPLSLAYNNYKVITPPQAVQNFIDGFISFTPLPKTPRIILAKSKNSFSNIKTANVENIFEISTEDKASQVKSASLTLNGPVDFNSTLESKISLDIAGAVSMEGVQLSASGSVRKIQNNLYFKINEFPAGSQIPIDQYKNQWFFINIDELQGKKENDTNLIFKDLKNIFGKYSQKSAVWSQKSEDKSNYTLKISPPKGEINNLLFDIIDTIETNISSELEKNIQKETLEEFTHKLEKFEINIVVDKKTYMVKEINLQTDLTIASPPTLNQTGVINLSPANQIPVHIKFRSIFTNYDLPVIVQIPDDAIDLKKIINQYIESQPDRQKIPYNPFSNSTEGTPQAKPKEETGFKNLLDNASPVLGTQNTNWDRILLNFVSGIN